MVATRSWSYCRMQSSSRFRDLLKLFFPKKILKEISTILGIGGSHHIQLMHRVGFKK